MFCRSNDNALLDQVKDHLAFATRRVSSVVFCWLGARCSLENGNPLRFFAHATPGEPNLHHAMRTATPAHAQEARTRPPLLDPLGAHLAFPFSCLKWGRTLAFYPVLMTKGIEALTDNCCCDGVLLPDYTYDAPRSDARPAAPLHFHGFRSCMHRHACVRNLDSCVTVRTTVSSPRTNRMCCTPGGMRLSKNSKKKLVRANKTPAFLRQRPPRRGKKPATFARPWCARGLWLI